MFIWIKRLFWGKEEKELLEKVSSFIDLFELVFDQDWDFSKGSLEDFDKYYASPHGTFLNPKINDESNNWANRGSLLYYYRDLVKAMKKYGIYNDTFNNI